MFNPKGVQIINSRLGFWSRSIFIFLKKCFFQPKVTPKNPLLYILWCTFDLINVSVTNFTNKNKHTSHAANWLRWINLYSDNKTDCKWFRRCLMVLRCSMPLSKEFVKKKKKKCITDPRVQAPLTLRPTCLCPWTRNFIMYINCSVEPSALGSCYGEYCNLSVVRKRTIIIGHSLPCWSEITVTIFIMAT